MNWLLLIKTPTRRPITMLLLLMLSPLRMFVARSTSNHGLELSPYQHSASRTDCKKGLVAGKDRMVFNGIADFTDRPLRLQQRLINFEISKNNPPRWIILCQVSLMGCNPRDDVGCYCPHRDDIEPFFNLVLDLVAVASWYPSTIRLSAYSFAGTLLTSVERAVPPIYNPAIPKIIISGRERSSADFSYYELELPNFGEHRVEFCVENLSQPFTISITKRNSRPLIVTNQTCLATQLTADPNNRNYSPTVEFAFKERRGCAREQAQNSSIIRISPDVIHLGPLRREHVFSSCHNGTLPDDIFLMQGWINLRNNSLAKDIDQMVVVVQVNQGDHFFTTYRLKMTPDSCNGSNIDLPQRANIAYCLKTEDTRYEIIINTIASLALCNRVQRLQLRNKIGQPVGTSMSQPLPAAYLPLEPQLWINQRQVNMTLEPKLWNIAYKASLPNFINFCVKNIQPPCQLSSEIGGRRFTGMKDSSCLLFEVGLSCIDWERYLMFSYTEETGCQRSHTYIVPVNRSLVFNGVRVPKNNAVVTWKTNGDNIFIFCVTNYPSSYELSIRKRSFLRKPPRWSFEVLNQTSEPHQCVSLTRLSSSAQLEFISKIKNCPKAERIDVRVEFKEPTTEEETRAVSGVRTGQVVFMVEAALFGSLLMTFLVTVAITILYLKRGDSSAIDEPAG